MGKWNRYRAVENMKKSEKRSRKNHIWKLVCLISVIGMIVAGMFIVQYQKKQKETQQLYTQMQTESMLETEKTADDQPPKKKKTQKKNPLNFDKLQEQNEDIYAWIDIPGTNVNYPILQDPEDNSYYLDHTVDHREGYPGSIYTEKENAKDFSDPNTVVYGHNMKNGSMFADLHLFEDQQFFNEHSQMYIYTPDQVLEYQIFAAYLYDDRHLLNSFDFSDKEIFESYIEEVFAQKGPDVHFRDGVKITSDQKIITLSTCVGSMPQNRWLVQAVRIDE